MIVRKLGVEIDTENMNNNHLYTYSVSDNLIHKIEVNFKLEDFKNYLEIIKESSILKEGFVENIEYDLLTKKPITNEYDEIKEFLCSQDDFLESKTLLGKNIIKKAYLKWLEYPRIYHELKKILDFKIQPDINKTKDIDLNYYLEELEQLGLKEELLDILEFNIVTSIEKNKLEELNQYQENGFISMNKQIEIANKYLEYGRKNYELIKKLK